ncbi:hypothetical protein SBOR_6382 [Sclerotinia borealis F-4128]|uniref:Major facilitator superfamily (MFS) profile domain-containing protein n=1 Tax=Sclerotinia borealis (strain F-4128) TaxID=1432307 RepID=W9CBK1_SCLBF|nr:hypothetical protein SBOR_6382 [Sclerotinia borealis F-4128]
MANLENLEDGEHKTSISHTTSSEDIILKSETPVSTETEKKSSKTPEMPVSVTEEVKILKGENAASDEDEDLEYISGYKIFVVLAAITLTSFLALLDTTIIATAIPRITNHFHSLDDVGWYGSAYLITNCSLQPLSGKLYTYFSSKYTFLTFFFLFEFGSLLSGIAVSSNMLIVGRAVAGLGSAGLMNGAITILTHSVPIEKRPVYLGFIISSAQLALAVGPLIGGALTEYATWRWCFYINLPCGFLVSLLLLSITIPERLHPTTQTLTPLQRIQHLDLLGFFLFVPTAIQFLLALQWGGTTYPWNSSSIIGLFTGSFFNFLLFLYREYCAGDAAMIPFSIGVRGVEPTLSGVYTLPGILSQMLFAILSGFAGGFSSSCIFIIGGCFAAVGYSLLSTYTPFTPASKWIGYQIIGGIGRGLSMQMVLIAIQNNLPSTKVVIGQTLVIFFQYLGGALCLTIASTIFSSKLKSGLAFYAPSVDAQVVILAGATAYRDVIEMDQVMNVVMAYNGAINHCFYLAAGLAAGVLVFVWGVGWKKIGKGERSGREGGEVEV